MSLTAVVYKNREQMEPSLRGRIVGKDDLTGQFLLDSSGPDIPLASTLAIHQQLGNAAQVGAWREVVLAALSTRNSVILNQVLYSGSHCGDAIAHADVTELRIEIDELEKTLESDLALLLSHLKDLVRVSMEVGNPIAFI